MGRQLDRGWAVVALTVVIVVSTSLPAAAAEPVVVPVAGAVEPALPDPVLLLAAGRDELVVVNPTAEPLVVLDPDGMPFLRVSGAGVETDAAAPFTYLSRNGADTATVLPPGVADGAPPRWTRVSPDVSWRWHDPRLRPDDAAQAPVGGRSDVRQVLARWTVPLLYGTAATTLAGTLELQPRPGQVQTVADAAPAGLATLFPGGNRVVLTATDPVTVLGVQGEEFLRSTGDGWEVAATSRTHQLDLIAAGRPVPAGEGWVPHTGPGPVSWTDGRLTPPIEIDAAALAGGEVGRWSIPVRIGSRSLALTGSLRFTPDPAGAGSTGSLGLPALGAGVLALAAVLAGLAVRNRRRGSTPIERITTP